MNSPAAEPVSSTPFQPAAPDPIPQAARRRLARSLLAGTAVALNLIGILLNTLTAAHTAALVVHALAYTLMAADVALIHWTAAKSAPSPCSAAGSGSPRGNG